MGRYSIKAWLNNNNYTSKPDEVKVYCTNIVIDKYDAENSSKKLEGAKFILMREKRSFIIEDDTPAAKSIDNANASGSEDITYEYYADHDGIVFWVDDKSHATVVTTDKNGVATFVGLDAGTYYLQEIEAPDGYNVVKDPIKVEVTIETETDANGVTTAKKMCPERTKKYEREIRTAMGHLQTVEYIATITV